MNTKELMTFVNFVVAKYLRNKPELSRYREDLQQEGYIRALQALEVWDPSKEPEVKLFLDYRIRWNIVDYLRSREVPHFRKGPVTEGPYWDTDQPIVPEVIPDWDPRTEASVELMESLTGVHLTSREQEFLKLYLDGYSITEASDSMDIGQQRGSQILRSIVSKAKESNKVL